MGRKNFIPTDSVTCQECGEDFGAITARHLYNIHGYTGNHPINDYKSKFGVRHTLCADARKRIAVAKTQFWTKRGQHWTRATLLVEIQRLWRSGHHLRRRRVPVRVYEAGRRLFGTWQHAVERAGLNYESSSGVRHWTRTKVIERIQQLAANGEPLHANHIKTHYYFLYRAAIKRFPQSWAKALRAAGFDPEELKKRRGRWNKTKAEAWVRTRHAKKKRILAKDAPRDLLNFVYDRLETTWPDLLESLGIAYPGIKKRRDWTKSKLLKEMRSWKAQGHRMNYRAVKNDYQALIQQARKFYGSWDRARAAARV
jgi:hypothetical protein